MANYFNVMFVEYGIETISQAVSWGKKFVNNHITSLIDKVKGRLFRDPENSLDEYGVGDAIRFAYAWKVAHVLRWSEYDYETTLLCKKLFVKLRMKKVWKATEVEPIEAMVLALQNAGLMQFISPKYTVWKINLDHIADMMKKGMTPGQVVRLLKLIRPVLDGSVTRNMSNNNHFYIRGFHAGDWFESVIRGIRHGHLKHFDRFMRVFKHTHKISHNITGRFFTGQRAGLLNGLTEAELKMTVTDTRNWVSNGRLRFRLNVIVKIAAEWQPMRLNHVVDQAWISKFGRVPTDQLVRNLPSEVISSFSKATFGGFISEYKALGPFTSEQSHVVLALAKLHIWFGKSWRKAVGYDGCEPDVANIHDRGINLPNVPVEDVKVFLKRYTHKWADAVRIAGNWQLLADQGINPLGKEGLATSLKFLASMLYEGVLDIPFAQECATWGNSQHQFESLQGMWMGRNITYSSIPKVTLSEGDWKFYLLDRNDPRGPFLGEYTGCCQHPNGAGAACALHGTSSPDGGFVVLEHQGAVKFQSWVWRKDDTLVFDNIEGSCASHLHKDAKRIYLEGVRAFRGRLDVNTIYIGIGGSDIGFDGDLPRKNRDVQAPGGYTDSYSVWEVVV
jgi:hypothetical protein